MWERLKTIVGEIAELPHDEREAALRRACGDDTELFEEANSLLQSLDAAGEFLDQPAAGHQASDGHLSGRRIGAYVVEDLLATGGMGAVYRAKHERTGQTVALKVLRVALAGDDWTRRFEHEVQILGKLRHPAIAQIHDAGVMDADASPGGERLPYFVMEYVDGQALTGYAGTHALTTRQRIDLLIRVCEGVHHAHQRGVIHRDLKPDNVLVTESGHPKVLDFGVARMKSADDVDGTVMTRAGQLIGTLAYMSPEQVSGDPDDVGTGADVYALGVILFELLSGQRPLALGSLPIPKAVRVLTEEEPRRLSSVDRRFAGDLETITSKALEKDVQRRYASASELAADLRRFLQNEAILARPATAMYQLRKFAYRHRGLVVGVSLAFVALIAGLITTTLYMFEARRQTTIANDATAEASKEAHKARSAEADAAEFADFLEDMFESADLEVSGRSMTVVQLLDSNVARIESAFAEKPHLRARLFSAIGWDYFSLGEYEKAETYQRRALALRKETAGDESEEAIAESNRLSNTLIWKDRLEEADESTRRTLASARRNLGADHAETRIAQRYRAELLHAQKKLSEAEAAYRALLEDLEGKASPDGNLVLGVTNSLANLLFERGDLAAAETLYRRVYDAHCRNRGKKHTKSLVILTNIAHVLAEREKHDEAIAIYDDLLATGTGVWGPDHAKLWDVKVNYASLLHSVGRYDDARAINEAAYAHCLSQHGPKHADTVTVLNNLCVNLMRLERFGEAADKARALVDVTLETRGASNPVSSQALDTYANALDGLAESQSGDEQRATRELAKSKMEESIRINESIYGDTHAKVLIQRNNYARVIQEMGFVQEAVATLQRTVAAWVENHAEARAVERVLRWNLARAFHANGDLETMEAEIQRALALPEHPAATRTKILTFLAGHYDDLGLREKAQSIRTQIEK